MRLVLPLAFLLSACDELDLDNTPDDSCFVEGTSSLLVTLEADRDDIETSDLRVVVADCFDSSNEADAAVGDVVTIEGPSAGELAVTVSGTWEGGGLSGSCHGDALVTPEGGEGEVTVELVCQTDA